MAYGKGQYPSYALAAPSYEWNNSALLGQKRPRPALNPRRGLLRARLPGKIQLRLLTRNVFDFLEQAVRRRRKTDASNGRAVRAIQSTSGKIYAF